jgi:transcriptional regulator with XRE-family HTH domain
MFIHRNREREIVSLKNQKGNKKNICIRGLGRCRNRTDNHAMANYKISKPIKVTFRISRYRANTFGQYIRKRRLEHNLLQKDLAEVMGLNCPDTIKNWENDYTKPSRNYIKKLMKALDIQPQELIHFKETFAEYEYQLIQYLREHTEISRRQYQKLCNLSHNKARETLLFLVDIGILKREIRKGDTAAYFSLNVE